MIIKLTLKQVQYNDHTFPFTKCYSFYSVLSDKLFCFNFRMSPVRSSTDNQVVNKIKELTQLMKLKVKEPGHIF